MKVLLIIDHFGSGGAQRQMVELACGLKARGHIVEMFVYFPKYDFFRARLDERKIAVHCETAGHGSPIQVIRSLVSLLRGGRFDVAVSYLNTANTYAQLARIAASGTRLIVSERTSFHDDKSAVGALLRRLLYVLSDRVVTNSEMQAAWLRRKPWLRNHVSCIYNGVDLDAFQPIERVPFSRRGLRLLGIGRVGPEKNLLNLLSALAEFERNSGWCPEVAWAGSRDASRAGRRYCGEVDSLLDSLPAVRSNWHWLGLRDNVPELLQRYDALIHPSLYEGLPNAVCEALAAGMPVLASNVCDHPLLVADGCRGYLFDPKEPGTIAAAIAKIADLDATGWRDLGRNARAYASANLGVDRMVEAYEVLLTRVVSDSRWKPADE